MMYFILVAVVVLIGYFWVKRLSGLVYNNEQYTKELDRRFNYDEVLREDQKKDKEK